MAFTDPRNPAELILAPKVPQSRDAAALAGVKLNLGGAAVPGVITDPAQIAGPLRNTLTSSLAAKAQTQAISNSVTAVLGAFDAQAAKLKSGQFISPDPLVAPKSTGLPSVTDFFSFSALKPGAPIPTSFLAVIEQRKKQLQQLSRSFASIFTSPSQQGVNVTENTSPSTYPLPSQLDKPDVPALALGGTAAQNDPILQDKTKFTVHGVNIGSGKPSFFSRLIGAATQNIPTLNATVGQAFKDRNKTSTWSEPPSPHNAQFPYNKVQQSESGHVIEIDDTPGAERVHVFHRAGSFIEFHPDGSVVYKTMKHGYKVTMADEHVKVNGDCHVAIDGKSTLYVKGDVHIQSEGDVNVNAKGDYNVFATNINMRAKKTFKADGTKLDLRYMQLPFGIGIVTPIGGGFIAPRVNMSALSADFPDGNFSDALASAGSMDPNAGHMVPTFGSATANTPQDNPLSNWSAYTSTGAAAVAYRSKMFDTPEETNDVELYSAHVGLQANLGDITADARQLGGALRIIDTGLVAPASKPTINYLNFDDFKGNFDYTNDYVLANTTFKLSDVSDLALHPDIVSDITPQTDTSFEDTPEDNSSLMGGGGGDSSNGGGTSDSGDTGSGGAGAPDQQLP